MWYNRSRRIADSDVHNFKETVGLEKKTNLEFEMKAESKPRTKKSSDGNDKEYLKDLPFPAAYEYYKELAKRIIYIDTDIEQEADTLRILKQIIRWNIEDMGKPVEKRDPIYILFFCYGGDADICTALIDGIQASETPIIGVNLGVAYSAAAYIYISCPKRFMMERAALLFHQGSAQFSGDYRTIIPAIEQYQAKVEKLSDIVKKFTKIPEEEIEANIIDEWYMYSEEAVEKGAADKIVNKIADIFTDKD